ncbi:MAG: tetratricopeptide repeat protein [Planctomycetes bacterium]|nr:tetratricopeptide repeat protein [Planctomycetota bacterium]
MAVILATVPLCADPAPTKPRPLTSKESAALREEARAAISSGDFTKAAALIERTRKVTATSEQAAWLLIESECEYGRRAWTKSALAAMRIIALHPKSDHAGAALYWAARAYEQIGRPAKAAELYRECVDHKRTPASLRDAAKARLLELFKTDSKK